MRTKYWIALALALAVIQAACVYGSYAVLFVLSYLAELTWVAVGMTYALGSCTGTT